jgi:hypothetical protein
LAAQSGSVSLSGADISFGVSTLVPSTFIILNPKFGRTQF